MRTAIHLETDFARIAVDPKDHQTHEFLLEHALHQLMAEYGRQYGPDAARAVLDSLRGYHGRS